MERTLTLHIGTPESGTARLQAIVHAGRNVLRRRGTLYPGAGYLPRDGFNQQPAIYGLTGRPIGWLDEATRHTAGPLFGRLCDEVSAHRGHVVISAESLAFIRPSEAESLVERLAFEPASVTVVITVRDFGRILPSAWQQQVKNGSTEEFEPYLDSVAALRGRPDAPFWTAFGLPELVRRWSRLVGPQQVVLVTSPARRADAGLLWSRFATAASLPQSLVEHSSTGQSGDEDASLTPSQVELTRRLNVVMHGAGYPADTQRQVRSRLAQIWGSRASRPAERHLVLPEHLHKDIRRWAEEDILLLRRLEVPVVGTLTDLAPAPLRTVPDASIDLDVIRDVLALIEHGSPASPPRSGWAGWRAGFTRLAVGPLVAGASRADGR